MEKTIAKFEEMLLSLNRVGLKEILVNCQEESLMKCIEKIVVPAMESIGNKWESGEIALSQIYMSGRICEDVIDEVLPKTSNLRKNDQKIALVVFNDYHSLGKRIVYTFLRASGYEILDYGQERDIDKLIEKLKKDNIEILMISVLMLNSALHIKELIDRIKEKKLNIKVAVGGAPFRFDKELYKEIGADVMGTNASEAVDIIKKLKGDL